ncbi:hypothetical protein, partial [Shewanella decolorationis]|uniref:hypothetical protein n=1 Tax=Shewanella decolorationis TaxID=256839 RepID=UPI001F2850DF
PPYSTEKPSAMMAFLFAEFESQGSLFEAQPLRNIPQINHQQWCLFCFWHLNPRVPHAKRCFSI